MNNVVVREELHGAGNLQAEVHLPLVGERLEM